MNRRSRLRPVDARAEEQSSRRSEPRLLIITERWKHPRSWPQCRTPRHRGIGAAWRRGIGLGCGRYVTQSSDDQLSPRDDIDTPPHVTEVRSLYLGKYGVVTLAWKWGRAHEIPRANVRQIIQHSVAGCGGCSGDHACTGLCAGSERADVDQGASGGRLLCQYLPTRRAVPLLARYGFGDPGSATELDDPAYHSHTAPRARVSLRPVRSEKRDW